MLINSRFCYKEVLKFKRINLFQRFGTTSDATIGISNKSHEEIIGELKRYSSELNYVEVIKLWEARVLKSPIVVDEATISSVVNCLYSSKKFEKVINVLDYAESKRIPIGISIKSIYLKSCRAHTQPNIWTKAVDYLNQIRTEDDLASASVGQKKKKKKKWSSDKMESIDKNQISSSIQRGNKRKEEEKVAGYGMKVEPMGLNVPIKLYKDVVFTCCNGLAWRRAKETLEQLNAALLHQHKKLLFISKKKKGKWKNSRKDALATLNKPVPNLPQDAIVATVICCCSQERGSKPPLTMAMVIFSHMLKAGIPRSPELYRALLQAHTGYVSYHMDQLRNLSANSDYHSRDHFRESFQLAREGVEKFEKIWFNFNKDKHLLLNRFHSTTASSLTRLEAVDLTNDAADSIESTSGVSILAEDGTGAVRKNNFSLLDEIFSFRIESVFLANELKDLSMCERLLQTDFRDPNASDSLTGVQVSNKMDSIAVTSAAKNTSEVVVTASVSSNSADTAISADYRSSLSLNFEIPTYDDAKKDLHFIETYFFLEQDIPMSQMINLQSLVSTLY